MTGKEVTQLAGMPRAGGHQVAAPGPPAGRSARWVSPRRLNDRWRKRRNEKGSG